MRGLIGCEFSGTVRRAWRDAGHDVWSCDLLPAEDGSPHHIVGDVRDVITYGWDFLIAHPPCTRLCNSGVRWLTIPPPGKSLADMARELDDGAALFNACWNAPIAKVCCENPVMHCHARERIQNWRQPQIVQPWHFGDAQFKATGLYLRGFPPLIDTHRLTPPAKGTAEWKAWSRVHRASPGPERARERSRFFPGIAQAMVRQWGNT